MNGNKRKRRGCLMSLGFVLALCGFVSLLAVCGSFVAPVDAATVKLAADPNTDSDWASDNLYRAPGKCATPGAFAKVGNVIKGATVTFTDTVATDGDYCYAATAVDTAGNESVQSNKVEVPVNVNPPGAPPALRLIGVTP